MKPYLHVLTVAFLACVLLSNAQVAKADVIEPTPLLPPTGGAYVLQPFCVSVTPIPFCLANIAISNFQITSDTFSGGNETVFTDAIYTATAFQNVGGNTGVQLGSVTAPGDVDFLFLGRTSHSDFGTFTTEVTDFDFKGTFNGHTFEVLIDTSTPSTGSTTITAPSLDGPFDVTSTLNIFGDVSIDGSTPQGGTLRTATLTAVPEPPPSVLLLTCMVGLAAARCFWRRSRSS